MILTMIVFGLVLGRWWKTTLIAAAIVWPVMLLEGGVLVGTPAEQAGTLAAGGLLGAVNAAVGVAVHQAIRFVVRKVWLAVRAIGERVGRRPGRS